MVGRDGIEPSTNGLKVHCSTAELTAQSMSYARFEDGLGNFSETLRPDMRASRVSIAFAELAARV
jgi:hypothetical protein